MRQGTNTSEVTGGAAVEVEGVNEVVVATLGGITTDIGHQSVTLLAQAYWEAAATAENMTVRIRRGTTIAGTLVTSTVVKSIASGRNECSLQGTDENGEQVGGSYVLTMEESKAAAKDKSISSKLRATV